MGQADRTIIVHAFDDENETDKIGFSMSGLDVHNGEIRCSKDDTRDKMGKNDPHKVVFELANRSSIDLRFPKSANDAIWVGSDDRDCPRSATQHPDIKPQNVSPDGERLTVHNFNSSVKRLKFALRFESPTKPIPYDPIWDNRNGGSAK